MTRFFAQVGNSRVLALTAIGATLVTGCVGASLTPPPSTSALPGETVSASAGQPVESGTPAPQPSDSAPPTDASTAVQGLSWAAETDSGWLAGIVGGPTRAVETTGHASVVVPGPGQVLFVYSTERGYPVTLFTLDPATGSQAERLQLTKPELGLRIVPAVGENAAYLHSSADLRDFGVRRLDLSTNEISMIVPGGATSGATQRADLRISPDGHVLASALCDLASCSIDVVQLAGGKLTRIDERQLRAAGDRYLLLSASDGSGLSVVRVDTGEERAITPWEVSAHNPAGASVDAVVAMSGDRFLLARTSFGHYDLTLVDAKAANETLMWRDPKPGEVPALSPVLSMSPVANWVWLADAGGVRPGGPIFAIDVLDGAVVEAGTWSAATP